VPDILARIGALPADWPLAGSLRPAVLARIAAHGPFRCSAETGTGKSTLLLSHASEDHTVFTLDDAGQGDSLAAVRTSPLLCGEHISFVVGPSQQTLAAHRFRPLDLALIDGAHAFPVPQLEYYYLYPHLAAGALLVVDDVHIRSVNDLFRFLRTDAMFTLLEVVDTTAFFRRNDAPAFDPLGDGWWLQRYNDLRLPPLAGLSFVRTVTGLMPAGVRAAVRRLRGSHVAATAPRRSPR